MTSLGVSLSHYGSRNREMITVNAISKHSYVSAHTVRFYSRICRLVDWAYEALPPLSYQTVGNAHYD